MLTKPEKDKFKQEKYQSIIAALLRDEENKYCADCDAKGPRWASWNLGVFLCIRCAGIHRNLGCHISRVKSINLDSWNAEQLQQLQEIGNSRARAIYEASLPDSFRRPQNDSALESFIRAKYESKKYIANEWKPLTLAEIKDRATNLENELENEILNIYGLSGKKKKNRSMPDNLVAVIDKPNKSGSILTKNTTKNNVDHNGNKLLKNGQTNLCLFDTMFDDTNVNENPQLTENNNMSENTKELFDIFNTIPPQSTEFQHSDSAPNINLNHMNNLVSNDTNSTNVFLTGIQKTNDDILALFGNQQNYNTNTSNTLSNGLLRGDILRQSENLFDNFENNKTSHAHQNDYLIKIQNQLANLNTQDNSQLTSQSVHTDKKLSAKNNVIIEDNFLNISTAFSTVPAPGSNNGISNVNDKTLLDID